MNMEKLISEINRLKKEKNAVILVHNYQRPEIYKIADFIGDSLDLSKRAMQAKADIIVFCGVDFMAESAKILNPEKTVLLPVETASCTLANKATAEQLREKRKQYPDAAVVCYINSSAEVKAESDVCCTSMNAVKIVNSLPNKKIIFVPDYNIGRYVQTKTEKELILWNGFCYVHHNILPETVKKAKLSCPEAKLVAHPECRLEVLEMADCVTGTGGMIKYAKESNAGEFIVATELGMCERLKIEVPDKKFYSLGNVCVQMKKTKLENVKKALEENKNKIILPENIMKKARKALENMLTLK